MAGAPCGGLAGASLYRGFPIENTRRGLPCVRGAVERMGGPRKVVRLCGERRSDGAGEGRASARPELNAVGDDVSEGLL